jgi:group I intron endonuclease
VWDGEPNNAGRFAIPFWRIHYDQDMRCTGIYRIDLGNGNFYIGSSVDLKRREIAHRNDLRSLRHRNDKMQKCWNKYYIFDFIVLELCEEHELIHKEQLLLDKYFDDAKNLNLAPQAKNCAGIKHTDATRKNVSDSHKSSELVAAHMKKLAILNKGRVKTESVRKATSESLKKSPRAIAQREMMNKNKVGVPRSSATKQKLSDAGKAYWARVRMEKLAMEEMGYGKECS